MEVDQEEQPQASSTPSRLSLAALLSPSASPRPLRTPDGATDRLHEAASGSTSANGYNGMAGAGRHNSIVVDDEDAEMLDASQADQSTSTSLRVVPSRRAKNAAKDADRTDDATKMEGEAEDEEEEDEDFDARQGDDDEDDDDSDDDDDEDDDEDDDDDDDDSSSSDSGDSAAELGTEEEAVQKPNGRTDVQHSLESSAVAGTSHSGERSARSQQNSGRGDDDDDDDDRDSMMEELAGDQSVQNGAAASQEQVTVATNGAPKKKHFKRRSPSVDPALPTGPPPRPTARLRLKLSLNDEDGYLINVPDEVYKVFKADKADDAWVKWYESTMPPAASEVEDDEAGGMPDTSDLGGLARLLEKYPSGLGVGKKKGPGKIKKKDKNMDYEIGEYDTRDPFVDDSELNVDEPTYAAKPSADGFFVHEGEVQLQEIERDKLEANREDLLTLATKRGQMPAGFGQTDPETGAGGAGALYLQLGSKAEHIDVVNCLLSLHAVEFGIASHDEDNEDRKNQADATRDHQSAEASVGPNGSPDTRRGSRSSPIPVYSDDSKYAKSQLEEDDPPFQPIQTVKYPVKPVPKRLMQEFTKLRRMAAQESWLKKSKFPPNLRDPTLKAITVALALNELNDNFINWLPQIYPYNLFTVRKFVRRQFYDHHVGYMDKLVAMNETGMKKQIVGLYQKLKKEYDDAMEAWLTRANRDNLPDGGDTTGEKPSSGAAEDGEGGEGEGEDGGEGGEEEDGPAPPANKNAKPVRRWHWTEALRETLFTIMTIHNAKGDLLSEKKQLEKVEEKVSTINARKVIYKGLLELWPESGWVTTTAMSNQYGLYKRRVEKFAQMVNDEKEDVPGVASNVALY